MQPGFFIGIIFSIPKNTRENIMNKTELDLFLKYTWFQDDFDTPEAERYTEQMPDYEKYLEDKLFVKKQLEKCPITKNYEILLSTYQEPILNKEQIIHLSRHMNYLKFKIVKLLELKDKETESDKQIEREKEIEVLFKKGIEIRNLIALANFRLIGMIRKSIFGTTPCINEREEYINECYFLVLKCVDRFDYRKNINFSTYAVFSLRSNFYKQREAIYKRKKKYANLLTSSGGYIPDEWDFCRDELPVPKQETSNAEMNQALIKVALSVLPEGRDKTIFKDIFGIDDVTNVEGRKMNEVGAKFNISRERTRQIKEECLEDIRIFFQKRKIIYEN
jgi:RNA polymerase sigma factor (sigma-70 family)